LLAACDFGSGTTRPADVLCAAQADADLRFVQFSLMLRVAVSGS
jgi:hypothetical protein